MTKKSLILIGGALLIASAFFGCSRLDQPASNEGAVPTSIGMPVGPAKVAGDLITNVPLPVDGNGVSVAVDCDGLIYYTTTNSNLYVMDKDGNLVNTLPIVDAGSGQALIMDEMAWDSSRNVLWAQLHGSNPVAVYHLDRTTGVATFQWTSQTISVGTYRDGIAYDGSDDTIWISGDVSTTIEHYQADGTFLGAITPKNATGGPLGLISGINVGVGDLMYVGRNGAAEIVRIKKSNGDFIGSFVSPGGTRDEGLECDPVNFAPKLALWSREFNTPGYMAVIELEEGTCACGGGGTEDLTVAFDLHPTSCPNPVNPNSKGVTPAAILGTADFDVSQIDPESIRLEGVAPLRWNTSDVATPYEPFIGKQSCYDCNTLGPDGYVDLALKFSTQELIAALPMPLDECTVLHLTGNLKAEFGGTPFTGEDVMRVPGKIPSVKQQ